MPRNATDTSSHSSSHSSSDTATAAQATRRSIRLMVLAMTAFTLNDTLVKVASETMLTGQLIFLRGVLATAFVLVALRLAGTTLRPRSLVTGWVAVRAVTDAFATVVFLVSLFHLPLATASAITMVTPLVIAAMAAWWLGERVSAWRWTIIGAGFGGVLLIIQPGVEGFNGWAWLCLAGTLLTATRDIITRRIPPEVPSIGITLATSVAVTLLAGGLTLLEGWKPMALREWALLVGAAAFLAAGYQLIIRATRSGDISAVAPFRYVCLLIAIALGWLIWGHVPNVMGWAGIALVIGAGLVLLRQGGR
jgi:drug/metabolite transporter (DMT)-like permease